MIHYTQLYIEHTLVTCYGVDLIKSEVHAGLPPTHHHMLFGGKLAHSVDLNRE